MVSLEAVLENGLEFVLAPVAEALDESHRFALDDAATPTCDGAELAVPILTLTHTPRPRL